MDLLERYLQAVRLFLPRDQQDDIIRELSENLRSQIEDREQELGRPLTEDECADILRRHGHPMIVGGRYRSHQYLVGPVFFPMYVLTLKMGLGVAAIVTIVVAVVTAVVNGSSIAVGARELWAYPQRALMVIAWTTIGFALLDFAQSRLKLTRSWDPRKLPKLARREDRVSRVESFCELLFSAGAFVWLLLIPGAPFLLMGPAAYILDLTPIWRVVYVPMLLLTAATSALAFITFARPYWTPARSLARVAIHSFSLLLFVVLLRGGPWVAARAGATLPGRTSLDRLVDIANISIEIGLALACLIAVVTIARELYRWHTRRGAASQSTTVLHV